MSRFVALCAAVLMCLGEFAVSAQAETQTPRFEVVGISSADPLVEAYPVILFSARSSDAPRQSKALREFSIRHQEGDQWLVAVRLEPSDYAEGALLSVSVRTAHGTVLPGEVHPLHGRQERLAVAARCADIERQDESLFALNEQALRGVLDIRNNKVELLEQMLRDILTPERTAKLQAIERELNLTYSTPISPEMPVDELAYRLSAIEALR